MIRALVEEEKAPEMEQAVSSLSVRISRRDEKADCFLWKDRRDPDRKGKRAVLSVYGFQRIYQGMGSDGQEPELL